MDFLDEEFFGESKEKNAMFKLNICKFCEKNIFQQPFVVNDLMFCDIICAKLYFDKNNITKFVFDKKKYDNYFKNNLISETAAEYYKILRKINFFSLPFDMSLTIAQQTEQENEEKTFPIEIKNKYISILLDYMNQVLK